MWRKRRRGIQIAVFGATAIIGLGLLAAWLLEMELEKAAAVAGVLALFATVLFGIFEVVTSLHRPPEKASPAAADAASHDFLARTVPAALGSAFLPRVIDAIRSVNNGGVVTRISGQENADAEMDLLRVVSSRSGPAGRPPIVHESLIGVCDRTPTAHEVSRLVEVHRERFAEPGIDTVLIYGGQPADSALRRDAARDGVRLVSFIEYKIGFDLRPYAAGQLARLSADPRYRADLYVAQHYREIDAAGEAVGPRERPDVLSQVLIWLDELTGPFLVVLGPFGSGKTFLLREIARHMYSKADAVVPVVLPVRDLDRPRPVDELVAQQINSLSDQHITHATARELMRNGRIALLVDGFDELAMRVSHRYVGEQLQAFADAADGQAKVVIAGRQEFFRTDSGGLTGLGDRLNAIADRRIVSLREFDDDQIHRFLVNRLGDDKAARSRLRLVRAIEDLVGLARNPRMLDFIARIEESRLRSAGLAAGIELSAALYQQVLDQWLEQERARFAQAATSELASKDVLWRAVSALADQMWRSPDHSLAEADLHESVSSVIGAMLRHAADAADDDSRRISHLVGSGTLLIRASDGRFRFLHHSVLEWLTARRIAMLLSAGDTMPWPLRNEVGRLVIRFACGLAPPQMRRWATAVVEGEGESAAAVSNALEAARVLGLAAAGPAQLSGKNLAGEDLSGQVLNSAEAQDADLSEANLTDSQLSAVDFTGAFLVRARLSRAKLRGAVLRNADLTGARLLGADLTGADLNGVRARRAALIGAAVDPGAFSGGDFTGAALPADPWPTPQFRPSASAGTAPVAIADDGGLIAAGGSDGTIRIWDAGSGELIRVLSGHAGATHTVGFASASAVLASGGQDGSVKIWDAGTGELARELIASGPPVYALALSLDGRSITVGGQDGSVRRWDIATGGLTSELAGRGNVWAVTLSAKGHVAAGASATVSLWPPGGKPVALRGGEGSVWSLAFTHDGAVLVAAGDDGTVRSWSTESSQPRPVLRDTAAAIWSVAVSSAGVVAAGGADGSVRLWDVTTGRLLRTLDDHNGPVWSVAFAPDGQWLATSDGTIRLWDTADGRLIRHLTGGNNPVRALSFAGGDTLASGGDDRVMRLWSVPSGRCVWQHRGRAGTVRALALSPGGHTLAAAGGKVHVVDLSTGAIEHEFSDYVGPIRALAFSPDGRTLASGAGTIRITDLASQRSRDLVGHTGSIRALAFSPDGARLASAGDDNVARVWDARAGEVVLRLPGPDGSVRALGFSPTGDRVVTADIAIRIWDARDGRALMELPGHGAAVHAVAFDPSGRILAGVGADAGIRLWDAATGRRLGQLRGHTGPIWTVTFLGSDRWLASGGDDGTVRIWERATGACRQMMVPLADDGWMAIADDGRYKVHGVVTGECWLTVNMCRFEPGELDAFVPQRIQRVPADAAFIPEFL